MTIGHLIRVLYFRAQPTIFDCYYVSKYIVSIILMSGPWQEKEFQIVRKAITDKYAASLLDEQELMLRQLELLEECKDKIERRRAYESFNNLSLNITNISSIQNMSSTDESSFRNRFTEQFENSILNAAIKEVRSNCSEETFDTVMGYVMNNKNKQYEEVRRELDRKNKQCEELSALIIIKQKDITFLERDLSSLRTKEEALEDDKRRLKKKHDLLDEKEKRLHSAEMSLIFKQKLNLEGKRRYQRQKDINDSFLKQLQSIYDQLDTLWDKILQQMERTDCSCDKSCWKNEVMKKCKEQLVEQRKILQQEEKQIESQYDTLRSLSEQVKKVFVGLNQDTLRKNEETPKK